jgi:hypothetical protein
MEICLELEEIQMPPSTIGIMNIAFRVVAFRTWKFTTTFDLYVDVESLSSQIEVN